jgi:hypothetical protein
MHCEDCQNLLIDLAYDELDDACAAEVRQHLAACSSCAASWSGLQAGRRAAAQLAPGSPPPLSDAVRAAVLEAASGAVGASAARTAISSRAEVIAASGTTGESPQSTPEATARPGATVVSSRLESRWLDRIATLAARREVAMAAVFLLALGVGVTTLYNPSRNPPVTEEDRARDVIPAVEVNAESAGASEGRARALAPHGDDDSPARARVADRAETRSAAGRASPTTQAYGSGAPSGQSALTRAETFGAIAGSREATAPPPPVANAAPESAGVASNETASDRGGRDALERTDPERALANYRLALAAATDDQSRARIQRLIAALEAARATAAAQTAQTAQTANAMRPGVDDLAAPSSSLRATSPSRRVTRPASPRSRASGVGSDEYQSVGFKRTAE